MAALETVQIGKKIETICILETNQVRSRNKDTTQVKINIDPKEMMNTKGGALFFRSVEVIFKSELFFK